tara:strand:+ start:1922 stop:3091 length:1170 start_codon:yes stop_codon:yes gene_type:complete
MIVIRHLFPFVCLVIGTMLILSCKPAPSGPPPGMGGMPTVTVTNVEARMIPDDVSFVGRVAAKDRVDLRAQVSGILTKQHFEDGAHVKKGDLLFEIEPDDYAAALASAEAQVASAEAEKDNANQYLKRLKSVKSGGVSATELENAEIAARKAQAARDQVESARRIAELDLKRTKIHAPIDGQIGKAMVDAGNLVDAATGTLATIVLTDPIRVQHALSERFLTEAMQNQQDRDPSLPPIRDTLVPRITLSTGDRYPHEGKIVFLDNEVGANTGSIQAEAEFPNPDDLLTPGQFVDLTVQRGAAVERLLVPQSAVQQNQQGHFVLVADAEGNVVQRMVTVGDRFGPEWSIEQGVSAAERVITQGIEKVRPGAKVNAVETTTLTKAESQPAG